MLRLCAFRCDFCIVSHRHTILFVWHSLGAVHNCQHFPISTERTEGGRGNDAIVLILNVDILIMLPPGGYD